MRAGPGRGSRGVASPAFMNHSAKPAGWRRRDACEMKSHANDRDRSSCDHTTVPDGIYRCRVVCVVMDTCPDGTTPCWTLVFVVESGDYAGSRVSHWLDFSPEFYEDVVRACRRLGVYVCKPADLTPYLLLGRTCRVRVEVDFQTSSMDATIFWNMMRFDQDETPQQNGNMPTAALS